MSSTSVYREFSSEVTESANITKPSLQRGVEELVLTHKNSIILRLGGLMGEDRVAGRWSSAKDFEDGYVNYVHKSDVVAIVSKLISSDIKSGIYNVVAPLHPTRKEIHSKNAKKYSLELGNFSGFSHKIISSKKIIKELDYQFIYDNPLEFWEN